MAKTKISVDTTITRYTKKKGKNCFSLGLGDLKLSKDQRDDIDGMIDDSAKVKLTIELVQENLPGME